jgi:dienelactone hydrolase
VGCRAADIRQDPQLHCAIATRQQVRTASDTRFALSLWHVSDLNHRRIGVVGFCWGAKIAIRAARESRFVAFGAAHPSLLTEDDAQQIKCPSIILPAKEDAADLEQVIWPTIQRLEGVGAKSEYRRFNDCHHGWCAARAKWDDALLAAAAKEAAVLFCDFFDKHL